MLWGILRGQHNISQGVEIGFQNNFCDIFVVL